MGEMTLADIAAVTDRDNNAFGGNNGGMWIFALLILLMMGGGYWNKGNQNGGGEPVTDWTMKESRRGMRPYPGTYPPGIKSHCIIFSAETMEATLIA